MKSIIKILATTLLISTIWSCSPQKKIDKAVAKVLSNPEAKNKVGREWEKDHPCVNDTVTKVKSDTVTTKDTLSVSDTLRVKDTLYITKKERETVTRTIHDTVTNNVVDNRRLNIANDSLNYYKGLSQQRQARIDELSKEVKQEKKRGNKWVLYFWLLVGIAAGSHVLRSKLKIFS